MAAINGLLLVTGVSRAFVLFVDPYNTRRVSMNDINYKLIISTTLKYIICLSAERIVSSHTLDMGLGFM